MKVTLHELAAGYGNTDVLRGIDAAAEPGRITAVIGPNAAGKSTLLRCVIGALRPRAGHVHLDGQPTWRLRGRALAERLAYVPQRAVVSAAFTVREVVELGRYALPRSPQRVDAAIDRLELRDVQDRPFPALSVGQQQRVAVARALAQLDPASGCLVLDEPTASMDLRHARDGLAILSEVARQGATVLVALHDLSAAAAVADDVWLLAPEHEGAVVETAICGPVGEVMEIGRLQTVFGVAFRWAGEGAERVLTVTPPGNAGRSSDEIV